MNLDCKSMRALVIAGDCSLVAKAARELEHFGMLVTVRSDERVGLETACSKALDVVIFDAKLLGSGHGETFSSLRTIPRLCIVALTPSNDPLERVCWLEMGADDCMTIPCLPQELTARIRATVRCAHRFNQRRHSTLQVGKLSLSRDTMHAELNGAQVDVTSYEFALLWALARNSGKVMSREQLLEQAKGSADDAFERSIDVQVSRLRNKLGDDPRHPRLLKTVRGAGYLLAPEERNDRPKSPEHRL